MSVQHLNKINLVPLPVIIDDWPEPMALPGDLAGVDTFNPDWLPADIRDYIVDIHERMGCPIEYPIAAALVMGGSLLGCKVRVQPKQHDDSWTVPLNLYGMVIGDPGTKKSEGVAQVLRFIDPLEAQNEQDYRQAVVHYKHNQRQLKALEKERQKLAGNVDMNPGALETLERQIQQLDKPQPLRQYYRLNESTIEALQVALSHNPNGLLYYRDELMGLFKQQLKKGHENDRQFLLEAWNGNKPYTKKTVNGGDLFISNVCLSVLGTIQPDPLHRLINDMAESQNDGFMDRFQVMVYPDKSTRTMGIDRVPNHAAKQKAENAWRRCIQIKDITCQPISKPVTLCYSPEAQAAYNHWKTQHDSREQMETGLFNGPLSKQPSLINKLAGQFAWLNNETGQISLESFQQAEAVTHWLEHHNRRVYNAGCSPDIKAAKALLSAIQQGRLSHSQYFSLNHIQQRNWAGLQDDRQKITTALNYLVDYGHIRPVNLPPPQKGRPPSQRYELHPRYRSAQSNASTSLMGISS